MPHYKDSKNNIYYIDDVKDVSILPSGCVAITDQEADLLRQPTQDELLNQFRQSALMALSETSRTMERIIEAVSVGATTFTTADVVAYMNYRRDLRSLISSTSIGTLPTKPPYPAGT